jgi:hypothetical protein
VLKASKSGVFRTCSVAEQALALSRIEGKLRDLETSMSQTASSVEN